jgi:uncharacterized protein YqhQ
VAYQTLKSQTNNPISAEPGEGMVKIAVFVAYIWVIGRKPDIHRIFEYHGAEHKVVFAVENGRPLTPGRRASLSIRRIRAAAPASRCLRFWSA